MSFLVCKYHFPVWCCFICTQFGHGLVTCRNLACRMMCSGNLRFRSEDGSLYEQPPLCQLCRSDHRPTSHTCLVFHKALGIAENNLKGEVNSQLRGLRLLFCREARSIDQPNLQSAAPPQADTSNRTLLFSQVKTKHLPCSPVVIPGVQMSNHFSPLINNVMEEEDWDSILLQHLSVSTHPSFCADAVIHCPSPTCCRRSPPHPQPCSTSHQMIDWSLEEELVEVTSQEGPEVTSPCTSPSYSLQGRVVCGSAGQKLPFPLLMDSITGHGRSMEFRSGPDYWRATHAAQDSCGK